MTAHRMLESFAARFDVSALEEDEATMVAVDAAGTIAWTNRAWAEFAKANGGETVLARFTVGTSYLDGISGQTRSFYESWFRDVQLGGRVCEQDYECSSPDTYRSFRLRALPIGGRALLLVHHRRVERPHDREVLVPTNAYLRRDGSIVQCANCRCIRRQDSNRWDWVPDWVKRPPARTSHGICDSCLGFYWGAHLHAFSKE